LEHHRRPLGKVSTAENGSTRTARRVGTAAVSTTAVSPKGRLDEVDVEQRMRATEWAE
jgi:hypothetical protein